MNKNKQESVAASAEKVLTDHRFDWLRTSRNRVLLAIATIIVIALVPAAYAVNSVVGLLAILATFGMYLLLRLAVRSIADLPDEYLDERQVSIRDDAYRAAFLWFAGLVVVMVSALLLLFMFRSTNGVLTLSLTWETLFGWVWVVIAASMCMPSIVLALRDREVPE